MSKGVAEQFSEFLEKFLRAVGPWIRLLCMSCGISADCCQSFRQNLLQQGLNALRAYKPPNTMDIHSLQQFLANPHNDNKRLSDLQKQFACMWHANKCIKVNSKSHCSLPICPEWRVIVNHYSGCNSGYGCPFQSCGSSRVLINHYNSCIDLNCQFCAPLKKLSSKKTSTIVCTEIQHCSTSGPSTSEFAASISKGFCSGQGWSESSCTARAAYFSTYNDDYDGEQRTSSYQFMTASFTRRPTYGKTERIQRELIVMHHVQKCAELDHDDASRQRNIFCSVPGCQIMKRTLIHIAMCQGERCKFPECEITRSIIQHWLRCPKRRCDVCSPVLDSIPALDEGSHYEMDDKLLGLLYTSTNGLIDIVSSDLSLYEDECLEEVEAGLPRSVGKRKFSNDRLTFPSSIRDTSNMDKKRRMD